MRDEATEDLSFEQSPEIKSFKEMVAALQKDTLPSGGSEATTLQQRVYFKLNIAYKACGHN